MLAFKCFFSGAAGVVASAACLAFCSVACAGDCNVNGIDDSVEILGGSGSDCNSNGLIDACDIGVAGTSIPQNRLSPFETEAFDAFGSAAAIGADVAAVGAPLLDCGALGNCGAVFVYRFQIDSAVEEDRLEASDPGVGDEFGSAIDVDDSQIVVGSQIIIGARYEERAGGFNQGAAYVFVFDGAVWSEQVKLIADDAANQDQLGTSVAIDGDLAAAGAPNVDCPAGGDCGAVYVFRNVGGVWSQEAKLTADIEQAGAGFGETVTISNGTIAAGAPGRDCVDASADCGAVYVFDYDGSDWNQRAMLAPGDAATGDAFGSSLAQVGTALAAGAPGDDCPAGGDGCGSVSVFRNTAGTWIEEDKLLPAMPSEDHLFGSAVSIHNDVIVVGATGDQCTAGPNCGAVYTFRRADSAWTEVSRAEAFDGGIGDGFGSAVGVFNDRMIIGAPGDQCTAGGNDCGAAYLTWPPSLDAGGDGIPDQCIDDCNTNSIDDSQDITAGTSADCNTNQIPDECDIAAATSTDCNSNDVPDECDIGVGTSGDCNDNSVPDECDITIGTSTDCDNSGVPDLCELAGNDCNSNGMIDGCEIALGQASDCNSNAMLDACDITFGTSEDCNGDGLPDACVLLGPITITSSILSPIGQGSPQVFSTTVPVPSQSDVTITFHASADLNFTSESITLRLNGQPIGTVFATGANECPALPDEADLTVDRDTFNVLVADGLLELSMIPTSAVNPGLCSETSYIQASITYVHFTSPVDCNSNGRLDMCDIDDGISQDCNANGVPDTCDAADGASFDCNNNTVFDECDIAAGTSQDCNNTGTPDACDLAEGTSADCDASGVPDECQLTGNDCNGNVILDSCDLAGGTSIDCNANSRPDTCDLADGIAADCNVNNRLDECDLAAGTSSDCNSNAVPDECEFDDVDCNGNGTFDGCELEIGRADDCNSNGVPDECDEDCNGNRVPDECDLSSGTSDDCNHNSVPDTCDLALSPSLDCNDDGAIDTCTLEEDPNLDCNNNGILDECDVLAGEPDCNGNKSPDSCDLDHTTRVRLRPGYVPSQEYFGASVSIDGDVAVVGSPDYSAGPEGSVYVFRKHAGSWKLEARLTGEPDRTEYFGEVVRLEKDTIVVTALQTPYLRTYDSAVYVFRYNGQAWAQEARLTDPTGPGLTRFGIDVDINNGRIAVVNSREQHGSGLIGAVYIYEYVSGQWQITDHVIPEDPRVPMDDDPNESQRHLTSVSLRSSVLAVSTNINYYDDEFPAVTYVFRCDSAATADSCVWRQETRIPAIDQIGDDAADVRVGDGALSVYNYQGDSADLYVHRERDGGYGSTWTRTVVVPQNTIPVAMSNTRIIVKPSGSQLCAYPYTATGSSTWDDVICFTGLSAAPIPLGPERVAIDGNQVLLGDAVTSSPAGVYASLITLTTDCNGNGIPDECDIATGESSDCNSNGLADECDILAVNPDGRAGMDASDLAFVADCFNGTCGDDVCTPSLYEDACCELADWDVDGDVDLVDYGAFQTFADNRVELDCNFNGIADSLEAVQEDFFGSSLLNYDELTELVSFCVLAVCTEGTCNPPVYPDACCLLADTDLDGDVDLKDYALFQAAIATGP